MNSFGQAWKDIESEEGSGTKVLQGVLDIQVYAFCGSPWEDTNALLP